MMLCLLLSMILVSTWRDILSGSLLSTKSAEIGNKWQCEEALVAMLLKFMSPSTIDVDGDSLSDYDIEQNDAVNMSQMCKDKASSKVDSVICTLSFVTAKFFLQ